MALRIRKDGRLLCAAMYPEQPGDTYLHDGIMEILSGSTGEVPVIGSEPMEKHGKKGYVHRGEWWWLGNIPDDVKIDPFYIEQHEKAGGE